MQKRMWSLLGVLAMLMTGIVVRLWIVSGGGLQAVSVTQSTKREVLAVSRGTVYDRYLQPLVNRSDHIVAFIPPWEECLEAIRASGVSSFSQVLANAKQGRNSCLISDAPFAYVRGMVQVEVPTRFEDVLACHVVGYTNGEGQGVCGVERAYNELLSRYSGQAEIVYCADALGRMALDSEPKLESNLEKSKGGVVLTLDAQIQELVQNAAEGYLERGAVLVSCVDNGEILASVSMPSYDPNRVEEVLKTPSSPLLDRTLINYNVGSVFKVLVAMAALENGVSVARSYTCTGSCTFEGVTIRCHNLDGDGTLDMATALSCSCNCYFIQLAQDIGAEVLYKTAQQAGFSKALTLAYGIDTATSLLPSRRDISASAALANFAIGQGELMTTPYHVAALMGAVANDGLWSSPSLYLGEADEQGRLHTASVPKVQKRLCSATTAACLREMLRQAVVSGTGVSACPSKYGAGGKTGTAQTGWIQEGEEVVQSWFVGYYPAERPQYVITVLSENGYNRERFAAPLFKTICDALSEYGLVEISS